MKDGHGANNHMTQVVFRNRCSANFLATMRMSMAAGRWFTDEDMRSPGGSFVVNAAMAKRYWPGANAVGQRITVRRSSQAACRFRPAASRRGGWRGRRRSSNQPGHAARSRGVRPVHARNVAVGNVRHANARWRAIGSTSFNGRLPRSIRGWCAAAPRARRTSSWSRT